MKTFVMAVATAAPAQDPQYLHLIVHLVDSEERKGNTSARVPSTRPGRPRFGNVSRAAVPWTMARATRLADSGPLSAVADPLEIVGYIRRPADAHSPVLFPSLFSLLRPDAVPTIL